MNLPTHFLSVDWGTTNFRLRVVDTNTLEVLLEHQSDQGIKALYEQYQAQEQLSQFEWVANYLVAQLRFLPVEYQHYPLILTGMASSSIGLKELEYADFPFDLSGRQLSWKEFYIDGSLKTILISGVQGVGGMMRGEETQAIGLGELLQPYQQGILLLPGTHSKHLTYRKGQFISMKNFMTGELFEVLSKKSILANSVSLGAWTSATETAFKAGLTEGFAGRLSLGLLQVRADQLIRNTPKEDNFYFLSGLLIGDELSYLKDEKGKIFLAASNPVFTMYQLALKTYFAPEQIVLCNGQILEKALLTGQKKILVLNES